MKLLPATVFFLLCFATSGFSQDNKETLDLAYNAYRMKDYELAKQYVTTVLQTEPRNYQANLIMGHIVSAEAGSENRKKSKLAVLNKAKEFYKVAKLTKYSEWNVNERLARLQFEIDVLSKSHEDTDFSAYTLELLKAQSQNCEIIWLIHQYYGKKFWEFSKNVYDLDMAVLALDRFTDLDCKLDGRKELPYVKTDDYNKSKERSYHMFNPGLVKYLKAQ